MERRLETYQARCCSHDAQPRGLEPSGLVSASQVPREGARVHALSIRGLADKHH